MTTHPAPSTLVHDPNKGLLLGFIGGFALSLDIPLIRLAGSDPYVVMLARGLGVSLVLWLYWRFAGQRLGMSRGLLSDPYFIGVGALSGVNNVFFTLAVFNTSTANVVFILAFNAMLAALISWPLTGERPRLPTWLAIAATFVGTTIIVWENVTSGNFLGDLFALGCAIMLALSLTFTRKSGRDLSLAPGYGGLVSGCFALPMVLWAGQMPTAPVWLLIDAVILVPIAGITLWLAPRYIPAPQVALFYLLETVLAPLWVWLVFLEIPSAETFIGGTIITVAISAHGVWELMTHRRKRRLSNAAQREFVTVN